MSYVQDVRHDVLLLLEDLAFGQPKKYAMVVQQITAHVREIPLSEPVGPDEE